MRKAAARITLVVMAAAALFGLYQLKGRHNRTWPFPRTDRLLIGVGEFLLWAIVVIVAVVVIGFCVYALCIEAGWAKEPKGWKE